MKTIAKTNAMTMIRNRTRRILLKGVDTLYKTVRDTTVAEMTINVDVTLSVMPRADSNPKMIKLLIMTTKAPGKAALMML